MALHKLLNSTSNAISNTKMWSIAKFFLLSKIFNNIFHHTKHHAKHAGKHIQRHHKKYIGVSSAAITAHLLIFKLAAIKIIGFKILVLMLTSFGIYNTGLEYHASANDITGENLSLIVNTNTGLDNNMLSGTTLSENIITGNILSELITSGANTEIEKSENKKPKNQKSDNEITKEKNKDKAIDIKLDTKDVLTNQGFMKSNGKWRGNKNLKLEKTKGKLKLQEPLIIKGDNAEFELSGEVSIQTAQGDAYTGEIQNPQALDISVADEIQDIKINKVIKVGSNDETIQFKDTNGDPQKIKLSIGIETGNIGDTIQIYFSQDETNRQYLTSSYITQIDGNKIVEFYTTHFTTFALGSQAGEFYINDDDIYTTGLDVILNISGSTITQMRFGNSITERNNATWESFSSTKSRTLSGTGNGDHKVYAEFTDGSNNTTVEDIIILNQNKLATPGFVDIQGMNRQTITFDQEYVNTPVVVATPQTDNNTNNYPIPTIKNVTTTGFQIAICVDEGDPTCGTGAEERLGYFVFDTDRANEYDWIEVGTSSVATDGSTTSLSLSSNFSNAPILRTTPQTYNQNGNIAAVAWVKDTRTTTSAELIGCVHQGIADACTTGQPDEIIGYIAIDTGSIDTSVLSTYQNGMKDISTSKWTEITFSPHYIQPMVMVTQNDDDGAQDPEYPWARSISTGGADIRYCEQDGPNDCDSHTSEKTYWFAIEGYDMTTTPTASIDYNPADPGGSGTVLYNVVATLTGFNKELITITNNGGSSEYAFTGNGSFTFEFQDAAGNTGETISTVDWIDKSNGIVTDSTPSNGDNAVSTTQDIIIEFSKPMNTGSVESVDIIEISPSNLGRTYSRNGNEDTVTISHNDFNFDTNYTITVNTGALDIDSNNLKEQYIFNFTTIKELPLVIAGNIENLTGLTRHHIDLKYEYNTPPVILTTPVTDNGENNYPIPTIKNVTTTGFDIAICVDAGLTTCSTSTTGENIDYFVFNKDISQTLDWIEVGEKSVATNGSTTNLSLSSNFTNAPILWTTPQTYNQGGNIAAIAWVNDNQTTSSADLIGCVHQGTANDCTSGQPNETIGYVAIDINNVNIDSWQNGMQSISNSTWTPITFSPSYIRPRIMVTQNDDAGSQDTQYPWARNISNTGGDIRYCEADGANYCDGHAAEKTQWFAIEGYDTTTIPTAIVNYNPTSGQNTSRNVIATISSFNKSGVTITNNGGSNIYTFTNNGNFTFEFEDLAGNTGEAIATVDWIDKTKPTATINYDPASGQNTSGNVTTTLTGFSESGVIITNNGGSSIYTFTDNGNFTFKFKDEAGNTGETIATVDRIDKTIPTIQSTDPTNGTNFVNLDKDITIIFNTDMNQSSVESSIQISPNITSTGFTRTDNKTLVISHNNLSLNTTYTISISTGAKNYLGTPLDTNDSFNFTTRGTLEITYNNSVFNEDLANDGSITGEIIILLTGDTFTSGATGNINTSNIPGGLTANFVRNSNNQITMTLLGNATNHADLNDINNISISFDDDAFTNFTSGDINNSEKIDIKIDFLDPYQQLQVFPIHDNLLDADTLPANGCDDGSCQEANYGDLDYGGCSDFGSKQIMRFDISSIGTGATIYSATFRMTKMNLDIGTGFEIKQIINNHGWIEGVGNQAGSNAEKALTGESNYKQRKRAQEDWNNGNPGLAQGSDYKADNIIVNPSFDTQGDETKTFDLNSTGVAMVQEWIDDESTNDGFAMMNSNTDWLIIRTSEYATVSERPLLTINYIPDNTPPKLISKTPNDDAIDISISTNLSMQFNEQIYANTGYNIYIKKTIDDTTVQTIDASNSAINIDNNTLTVIINPSDFDSNIGYYILIDSGAFQDMVGNTFTGISDKTIWNFTTINTDNIPKLSNTYHTDITNTSATMGGIITSAGSGNITQRGIYRSLIDGFSDGQGTKISENGSWSNTGTFILSVNGFSSGTQIYFKAFAVNSYGTGYTSTQGSFITKPGTPIIDITDTSNKSFRVNRDQITGADSYKLYVATDINFTNYATGYGPMTGITDNTNLVNGLDIDTNYFIKLVAVNNGGDSADSNITNTTTTITPIPSVHLKLEESGGSTAYDSISNHDGIIEGNLLKLQTGADNYAYNFDGTDDALSIVDFDYGPELSLYFRIKQSSASDNEFIFSHGAETDPNSINVYFNDTNQQLITSINGNTGAVVISGSDYTGLLDNEWHLYVLTLDYGAITGKVQSKVYIDGDMKAQDSNIDAPLNFDPDTNMVLGRRSTNSDGTYYNGYIDDFRIYNQYLLDSEVNHLYLSTLDSTPPTASISYNPGSGMQTSSDVVATLTGFSESGVIITNNLGQDTYTFTENGSFVFEFKDAAGNTGETTATVTWIVSGTIEIGVPNNFTFSGNTRSQGYDQILTGQYTGSDYFYVDDQLGLDQGRYTTISATTMTGNTYSETITNNNLFIKTNGIQKINGDDNSLVEINSTLNNYTPLSGQINYIFRNTATNNSKKGKYGDQPYLKINFPAFRPADNYHGQLIFTLYEN